MHENFLKSAIASIAKHGRTVSLVTNGENTGTVLEPVRTNVFTPIKALQVNFDADEFDLSLITSDDKLFLIAGDVDVPSAESIIDNNQTLSIVGINQLSPGNTTILYKVHCQ